MDRRPAPKGLKNSAQGFNPGKPQNKRFALKGREMRVPDRARTYCRARVRAHNSGVLQSDHRTPLPLVRTFDLAPLSGRVALGGRFPGCRVEIWRGGSGAPFPDPAHQTGRAVFPHPAFGQGLAFAHGRLSCLRFGIQRSLQLPNL
jgi:hypothetical protein